MSNYRMIVVTKAPHGPDDAVGGVRAYDTKEGIVKGVEDMMPYLLQGSDMQLHVVLGTSLWTAE